MRRSNASRVSSYWSGRPKEIDPPRCACSAGVTAATAAVAVASIPQSNRGAVASRRRRIRNDSPERDRERCQRAVICGERWAAAAALMWRYRGLPLPNPGRRGEARDREEEVPVL